MKPFLWQYFDSLKLTNVLQQFLPFQLTLLVALLLSALNGIGQLGPQSPHAPRFPASVNFMGHQPLFALFSSNAHAWWVVPLCMKGNVQGWPAPGPETLMHADSEKSFNGSGPPIVVTMGWRNLRVYPNIVCCSVVLPCAICKARHNLLSWGTWLGIAVHSNPNYPRGRDSPSVLNSVQNWPCFICHGGTCSVLFWIKYSNMIITSACSEYCI